MREWLRWARRDRRMAWLLVVDVLLLVVVAAALVLLLAPSLAPVSPERASPVPPTLSQPPPTGLVYATAAGATLTATPAATNKPAWLPTNTVLISSAPQLGITTAPGLPNQGQNNAPPAPPALSPAR